MVDGANSPTNPFRKKKKRIVSKQRTISKDAQSSILREWNGLALPSVLMQLAGMEWKVS